MYLGGLLHGKTSSWTLWQDKGSLVAPHTSVTAGIQSKSEWPEGFSCFSILFISEEINSVTNCGIYNLMRELIVRENETEKEGNRSTKKLHTMGLCIISFIAIALHFIANLACLIKGWCNHMSPHSTTATVYISDWKSMVRPCMTRTWVCFKSSHTTWWNWQNPEK